MRFCRFVEISRGGGSTQQSQRTEPCQCVSGKPWAYHRVVQGQMHALQCSAGVKGPALGAAAGLARWFVGGAVLLNAGAFQMWRRSPTITAHRALPVCEWPALGMPWGTARSNTVSATCSRGGGACTGACGRAGQVACGLQVLPVCGAVQRRRQHSVTTAHIALLVCE